MKPSPLRLLLGVMTFIGITVCLVWLYQQSPSSTLPEQSQDLADSIQDIQKTNTVSEETPVAPICSDPKYQWSIDDVASYQIEYQTQITTSIFQTQSNVDLEIKGSLHMRVLDVAEDHVLVAWQLDNLNTRINHERDSTFAKVYEMPVLVQMGFDGQIQQIQYSNQMTWDDAKNLGSLFLPLQFVISSTSPQSWQTSEEDGLGAYDASYQKGTSCGEVIKQKQNYSSLKDSFPNTQGLLKNSTITFHDSPQMWIRNASIEEDIHIEQNKKPFITHQHQYLLKNIPHAPADLLSHLKGLYASKQWNPLSAKSTFAQQRSFWDQRAITRLRDQWSYLSLDEVLQQTINNLTRGGAEDSEMLQRLSDYLVLFPERVFEFVELLKKAQQPPSQEKKLIYALEIAQHAEAQQALAAIADDDEFNLDSRLQAIIGMGAVESPSEQTLEALLELARSGAKESTAYARKEVSNTAWLNLGNAISHIQESNPHQYEAMVQELVSELESGGSARTLLKALGNTHHPKILEWVKPYVLQNKESTKSAAIRALRNDKRPSTTQLIKEQLDHPIGRVRQTILDTLKEQATPSSAKALVEHLSQEENWQLRQFIAQVLVEDNLNAQLDPKWASEQLKKQISKETSREVLEALYRVLYKPK